MVAEYLAPSQEHFRHWLGDPAGRDQIIMYRADQAAVVWNGRGGAQEPAYEKPVSSSSVKLSFPSELIMGVP